MVAAIGKESNVKAFTASKNHSYECGTTESVVLDGNVTIVFEKVHIQPFPVSKEKFNKGMFLCSYITVKLKV